MYSLVWGKAQQLCFADDHEYYRALGSLCRTDSYTITFETNSETDLELNAYVQIVKLQMHLSMQ